MTMKCILIFGLLIGYSICEIIDLAGNDWQFTNQQQTIVGQATVPGNIFQDLKNNQLIEEEEYSDVNQTWIARETWIYSKKFNVSTDKVKLVMKSLDSFGYIELNGNGKYIFFDSMFVKKEIDLKQLDVWVDKENTLKILFHSPIQFVDEKARIFKENNGFDLPPSKLPESYHGVDHSNFIRKMQASFSWDWGKQMLTSGIIDQIYLLTGVPIEIDSTIVETTRVQSTQNVDSKDWMLKAKVKLILNSDLHFPTRIRFYLNGEEIKVEKSVFNVQGQTGWAVLKEFDLGPFPENKILPWFPNRMDFLQENKQELKPNVYNLTVWLEKRNGSTLIDKKSYNIGFKEVKLIEKPLSDGKTFYFEINGIPLYIRGINYIPTTLNVGNLTEQQEKFTYLLHQVKDANMNMIRVWGGGMYEDDKFYDLADKLGIMVWQDFMYACALYEADKENLEKAKEEVTYQVRRLQHHPSISIFSGNNEIEGAISSKWWNELKDPKIDERLRKDYIELFEKTIRYTVGNLTSTIPFVASSPTNNDEHIFEKSGDPKKGDIHHYDYGPDSLNESKYPRARFVSEFGFQSYPSIATLAKSIPKEHLLWPITPQLEHRQHAPGQNEKIIAQINENLIFKNQNAIGQEALEDFIYYSQVIQALSVKLEAEGYLQDRDENLWLDDNYSLRSNVENINMGTLVWQLNDVWQAPTWSSIDYDGNWKILHYYMRKFYNLVHAVAHREKEQLVITLINDSLIKLKIKYYVIIYRNENGYLEPAPSATERNEVYVDKLSTFKQKLNLTEKLEKAACSRAENCFVRIDYTYLNEYLDNFYLLGRPRDLDLKPVEVKRQVISLPDQKNKYIIIVSSDKVALFVQLSWKTGSNIEGHLIDNGFNLLKEERYILFEPKEEYDLEYLNDNLQIRTITGLVNKK